MVLLMVREIKLVRGGGGGGGGGGGANLPPVGIEVFKKSHTFLQRVILWNSK